MYCFTFLFGTALWFSFFALCTVFLKSVFTSELFWSLWHVFLLFNLADLKSRYDEEKSLREAADQRLDKIMEQLQCSCLHNTNSWPLSAGGEAPKEDRCLLLWKWHRTATFCSYLFPFKALVTASSSAPYKFSRLHLRFWSHSQPVTLHHHPLKAAVVSTPRLAESPAS